MPYRQNFPIPPVIDPPRQCLCIEIPASSEWKAIINGNLSELSRWFNWERTGDDSGAQCAAVWKDVMLGIDWSVMSCGCGCGQFTVIYRWTVDGVLQVSSDSGETWTDDPTNDPRNSSPTYPPIPGEDTDEKRCVAAVGMAAAIKEQVGDNLTDDMSRYTLDQLVRDWVTTYIETSNPFEALVTIAANQIFALLISAVRAALTDPVYHSLECIFYDNMSSDASFNTAQWEAVRSDILGNISGVAGVFLEHLVYLMGVVGLTNLARSGFATEGDCSDCDCTSTCIVDWTVYFGDELSHSGCNIQAQSDPDSGRETVGLTWDSVNTCTFTDWALLTGSINDIHWQWYLADGSGPFTSIIAPTGQELQTLVLYDTGGGTEFTASFDFS